MKKFRKYLIISMVMIFAVLALMMNSVNASGDFLLTPNNGTVTTNLTNNTVTNNVANNTVNNTVNTTTLNTTRNTAIVNNINQNVTKDLPQTGENDTYVIAGIGILAIIIGAVAFIRSRKYNM